MRVIGLMSGTSVDGIDAALVNLTGTKADLQVEFLAGHTYPYPTALRAQILEVCGGTALSMAQLAELDDAIAHQFAQAALAIGQGHANADLIGSHGQTVFHRPPIRENLPHGLIMGYSLQLGRGALIAQLTQIETVSNFRAADLAYGGQGAPLVPPVDAALLGDKTADRAIQNIGGIGNVTYLPAQSSADSHLILGWDTGPGNMLLDLAVQQLSAGTQTYDADGAWAATGKPDLDLVHRWLAQPFFQLPPPKSTGRELFGQDYLAQCFQDGAAQGGALSPADFLATLTELTAASIADSYRRFLPKIPDQVLICGGGGRNGYLRSRLQANLPTSQVLTTDELGLNADYKEAIAFAVLAYWRQLGLASNLPAVTGASQSVSLGEIHRVDSICGVIA
jgi:anhydro-N-acetylmuramic acid kinase